jgi:hypothetical protein
MGLLSKANPGSHASAGFTPLDEPLLEALDELVAPAPPIPELLGPEPAAPDDSVLVVPPSPLSVDPGDEHAANPKIANPNGSVAQRIGLLMSCRLLVNHPRGNEMRVPRIDRFGGLGYYNIPISFIEFQSFCNE